MSTAGDVRRLVRAARSAGWDMKAGGRHMLLRSPSGRTLLRFPKGNKGLGNPRVFFDLRGKLRKEGVDV